MSKKIMWLLSFALTLGLLSKGNAVVIDSFETGVDSWEIMDPAETLVQAAVGVTDGAFSMQRNFTSGWHEIDLGGISVDDLNANDIIEVDVTTSVTAEQMGWWLQHVIVLQGGNAAGSYYLQSEVADVASPDGTLTTTTVSFEYSSLLADGLITGWAKIRLIGNTGPGPNGILYYDNLRAVSVAPPGKTVVYDFETGAQGWGDLKDGTATTVVGETHAAGGSQSLRSTIDEAAHGQAQGGWSSSRDFTADDAVGGINNLSFWYRADDPDFNGGNFVFHWIMSTEGWSGGGWYGNGLWGVVVADGQWHQQTVDLSILGEAAGGWQGTWGDQTAWEFRDDLLYSFEIMFEPTDSNTTGSNVYIDDIQFLGPAASPPETTTVTISDFESGLNGWFTDQWVAGTVSLSPTGATGGSTQAMLVEGPGGWQNLCKVDAKPYMDALANRGVTISVDVTAFSADMTTTWMQVGTVINAQSNDDNGPHNNVGWNQLDVQDVALDGQPHTLTWVLSDELIDKIAGADQDIGWFELQLLSNVEDTSAVKFYVDNIQLSYEGTADAGKSTDTIIGNWEQDLDGWVVGGGADALFNDHNGVTLGDYSLDIFVPNGDWNQDVLTLDVIAAGLLDIFKVNRTLSADVTRMNADFPTDKGSFGWNGIHVIINAGGDGWNLWQDLGYQAHWTLGSNDTPQKATWEYGEYLSQIDFDNLQWLELKVVSNANDTAYTGWVLFYLDNMMLTGAGLADNPKPADGATDVPIDTKLSWTPGTFATTHHVYFGLNSAKVRAADMDSDPEVTFAVLDANSFDPGELEFKTQYYWRIDEVNEASPDSPWPGAVWSFTAADFLIIDDFEAYNTIDPGQPGSNRLFESWSDGFGVETNGALVGHDFLPYTEQSIVNNGIQSMPIYYDNTGAALQSEAQRVWSEPQVWMTSAGTSTLTLFTHGAALNTIGELYLIVEDSAGASHKVVNSDSTIFNVEEWIEWEISLNEIADAGVNLATVAKLIVGIADLPGQPEAKGILYIDDIRRYPPVVVSLDPDHVVVPKTAVAPVIDGVWDTVWDDVNAAECLISEMSNADSETPENAADLSAVFKAFYDDTNFYVFVEVQDSLIDYEFSDWQGDGLELYFDGDYSHGDSYDGVNDNQIRITVDDVVLADTDSSLPIDGTVFKVLLTATGYNIEAAFPLDVLQIYPSADPAPLVDADGVEIPNSGIAPNNIIGFEVQINDNDASGGRQTMLRWHSDNNDSWDNPSLFGQARLVDTTAGN